MTRPFSFQRKLRPELSKRREGSLHITKEKSNSHTSTFPDCPVYDLPPSFTFHTNSKYGIPVVLQLCERTRLILAAVVFDHRPIPSIVLEIYGSQIHSAIPVIVKWPHPGSVMDICTRESCAGRCSLGNLTWTERFLQWFDVDSAAYQTR